MYDYPSRILETKRILENKNMGCFGLMDKEKITPYEYTSEKGESYAFFGHCWRLYTETNKNEENKVRVVDVKYDKFVKAVEAYTKSHRHVSTFCFMHWNYDLENLPFPMHRKISKELIDKGVTAVIGSHSHVPQGFEIYKEKLIAYCSGNFFFHLDFTFMDH